MSKYDPFKDYLSNEDLKDQEIRLSFKDIESILTRELPYSARTDRVWWANTLRSNQAKSWLMAGWKVHKVDLKQGVVYFQWNKIADIQPPTQSKPLKGYHYLQLFLQDLPAEQRQLALSFQEFGTIIRQSLPNTAHIDRTWWANTQASPQGASWTSAGWKVERIYLKTKIVVFRKRIDNPLSSIPRYISSLLDNKSSMGHPDNHTLMGWIGFCRKIGWFFEGTILYERGGLASDTLDNAEAAEVEEHYAVCKRELTRYRK